MRQKWIQWIMITSAISGVAWLGGLGWTIQDYLREPAALPPAERTPAAAPPTPTPPVVQEGSFRLLVLGDSLARGTGDPDGKGFVGYMVDEMKGKTKQEIVVDNYGVNGQTSSQLAASLQQAQLQAQVKAANVIVVSIGGNDLFLGGETLGNLNPANIKEIEDKYLLQLDAILKLVREHNASARIFLIGLYNPFIALQDTVTTTKIVRDWNYKAAEAAASYPQAVLVPTFDLFQLKVQNYLARDLFHPNAAGYRLIGERVASLITW
ncbi:MAG: lipase [Paenibacillus sp.]|jgi:lysophospholipase L1-like esterase|nr:lipase [Paenibacillus sp.]